MFDAAAPGTPLFRRLAPLPPAHPRSTFPMLPVLGRAGRALDDVHPRSRFLEADVVLTASGREAIYLALKASAVGAGDRVIVPAYHCPTMIWPIVALGAVPVLVPISECLDVDPDELARAAGAGVKAVLLPHFFGIRQAAMAEVRTWCDRVGAALIEDCAHAFYGADPAFVPGYVGHFAIASTRKFFPGVEGGAVAANDDGRARALRGIRLPSAGLGAELRAIYDLLHAAQQVNAWPWQGAMSSLRSHFVEGPADDRAARRELEPGPASAAEISTAVPRRRALRSTSWIVHHSDHARSVSVRRRRWCTWRERIASLAGARALRGELPHSGAPYVFPVLLRDPARQFPALKRAGVQVWRWDQLAESGCATSRRLGTDLVQLPCVHSLPDERFEVLAKAFCDVIAATR